MHMTNETATGSHDVYMPTMCQDVIKNAARWPNSIAISDGQYRWTWREFQTQVGIIASRLRAAGAREGSVIAVYMPNSAKYVATVYAIWATGATFCPINYRLSRSEATHMLKLASAMMVVIDDDKKRESDLAEIANMIVSDVVDEGPVRETLQVRPVSGNAPAWLFFTSGTSGSPKPAVITQRQIDAVVSNGIIDLMTGLGRDDAALAVAPLSHGALTHVLRQVRVGGHTVVYDSPRYDEARVLRLIVDENIKSTFMVPTMVRRLCEAAHEDNYQGTLTHLLSGGEPITRKLVNDIERVFGRILTNYYGLAEVTGAISQATPETVHAGQSGPVPAGQARCGTSIELRNPEGRVVGQSTHGEIWVSGSNMFAGYLVDGRIDRSEIVDGWFNTKDIGYFENGCLYIDGRSSDMFISGGSNVYPAEVEQALLSAQGVSHAAVVGVPDAQWGEIGVAFIVPKQDDLDARMLAEHVRQKLAGYKVPRQFVFVDSLPHTPMDKVDKKRLKSEYAMKVESDV